MVEISCFATACVCDLTKYNRFHSLLHLPWLLCITTIDIQNRATVMWIHEFLKLSYKPCWFGPSQSCLTDCLNENQVLYIVRISFMSLNLSRRKRWLVWLWDQFVAGLAVVWILPVIWNAENELGWISWPSYPNFIGNLLQWP